MRKPTTAGPMALLSVFYAAMAGLALYGQSDGLMSWMAIDRIPALAVALAVELLAAVLFAFADWRRVAFGEQAIAARLLSVSVALGVAAMNFYGHEGNIGTTALYTGASLAGYAVLVLHTEARRRDALRAAGRLPAQAPAYGLALWLRMPATVWRARQLAVADPVLGVYDSIAAAETEAATAVRHRALVAALRVAVARDLDPVTGRVALASCDLDAVAVHVAEGMDYNRLAARFVADIAPVWSGSADADVPPRTDEVPAEGSQAGTRRKAATKMTRRPVEVTRAMAAEALAKPGATRASVAKKLRITERRLRQILNEATGELPVVIGAVVPTFSDVRAAFAARLADDARPDGEWLAATFPALGEPGGSESWPEFIDRTLKPRVNGHDVLAGAVA